MGIETKEKNKTGRFNLELEKALLKFVVRIVEKENATPEELKVLPEVAEVLTHSLYYC